MRAGRTCGSTRRPIPTWPCSAPGSPRTTSPGRQGGGRPQGNKKPQSPKMWQGRIRQTLKHQTVSRAFLDPHNHHTWIRTTTAPGRQGGIKMHTSLAGHEESECTRTAYPSCAQLRPEHLAQLQPNPWPAPHPTPGLHPTQPTLACTSKYTFKSVFCK